MKKHAALLGLVGLFVGCAGEVAGPPGETPSPGVALPGTASSPLDILDENGAVDVDAAETEWLEELNLYARQLEQGRFERLAFFAGNQIAEDALARSMTTELGRQGIDAVMVIEPTVPGEARLAYIQTNIVPVDAPAVGPVATTECVYAQDRAALERTTVRCDYILARARELAGTNAIARLNERPLPAAPDEVLDSNRIENAYEEAAVLGIEGASEDVLLALRESGVCDRQLDAPATDPRERGLELGRQALRNAVRAVEARTPNTQCDYTNGIAQPGLADARAQVPSLRTNNPLCNGFEPDNGDEAVRYAAAVAAFNDGVARGVEEAYPQELARLTNSWVCVPPPPPPPPVHVATPSPTGPAPVPAATVPALVPVYAVCRPNGCGGCIAIDWDYWQAHGGASYECMATPSWTGISGGLPCPGGFGTTSRVVGYDSPENAVRYAPTTSYDTQAYYNSIISALTYNPW